MSTIALGLLLMAGAIGAAPSSDPTIRESKFELFVTNVDESARFYTTLENGSTVVALSPVPLWLPLRWLGFLRHPPLGTKIVFYSTHLEELRAALTAAGYSPGEIRLQSWGDRDFRVTDHDGYYVRVSEGHSVPRQPESPDEAG